MEATFQLGIASKEAREKWQSYLMNVSKHLIPAGMPVRYSYNSPHVPKIDEDFQWFSYSHDVKSGRVYYFNKYKKEFIEIDEKKLEIGVNLLLQELKNQGVTLPEGLDKSADEYRIKVLFDEAKGLIGYYEHVYRDEQIEISKDDLSRIFNAVQNSLPSLKEMVNSIFEDDEVYTCQYASKIKEKVRLKAEELVSKLDESGPDVWKKRPSEMVLQNLSKALEQQGLSTEEKIKAMARAVGGSAGATRKLLYGYVVVSFKGKSDCRFAYSVDEDQENLEWFTLEIGSEEVVSRCLDLLKIKCLELAGIEERDKVKENLLKFLSILKKVKRDVNAVLYTGKSFVFKNGSENGSDSFLKIEREGIYENGELLVSFSAENKKNVEGARLVYSEIVEWMGRHLLRTFQKLIPEINEVKYESLDNWYYYTYYESLIEKASVQKLLRERVCSDLGKIFSGFENGNSFFSWINQETFSQVNEKYEGTCALENDKMIVVKNKEFIYCYDKNDDKFIFCNRAKREVITNVKSVTSAMIFNGRCPEVLKMQFTKEGDIKFYTADKLGSDFRERIYSLKALRAIGALTTWVGKAKHEISFLIREGKIQKIPDEEILKQAMFDRFLLPCEKDVVENFMSRVLVCQKFCDTLAGFLKDESSFLKITDDLEGDQVDVQGKKQVQRKSRTRDLRQALKT